MDKFLKIYLAGAIERAPDRGTEWRKRVTPVLEKIGFEVVNPLDFDVNTLGLYGMDILHADKEKHQHHVSGRYVRAMKQIVETDLDALLASDVVFAFIDQYVGAGTLGEITAAYMNSIPVFVLTNLPLTDLSGWIFGCMTNISQDINTTYDQLRDWIGRGEVKIYNGIVR